ncbi:MAG: hydroxyacid dehydrogenase [Sphingobacteriales bacterium]|nr:MAG: hydroxyacid dehydrogenase [Sphingobacteriales bacterium]
MRKVLIAAHVHEVLLKGLEDEGYACVVREDIKQEEAYGMVQDFVGVITSTRLQIDERMIDAASKLEWIGRMGSGMEVIDVAYAEAKGIRCYGSPEGNANAVAEHALGMLLSLTKRIVVGANEVKAGKWLRNENRGIELEGKTIGIIGFGHTGRAFAKKLSVFDMNILAYDKYPAANVPDYVEIAESYTRIKEEADIISFHVPLQADTINYFNKEFMNGFQKPFILVNTSRGKVVNTDALYKGLSLGKVKGACLDVLEQEPLSKMPNELRNTLGKMLLLPQVIITPHIAGYSFEAVFKMSRILLGKIVIAG